MINKDHFRTEFIPYLKQFIARAKTRNNELKQVEIPESLNNLMKPMDLRFKTSFGQGSPAVVPWLGCFLPGQSAGKLGVSPVLLFRRDTNSLSVCYSVSETDKPADGNWPKIWPNEMVSTLPLFQHPKYAQSHALRTFSEDQLDQYSEISDSFHKVIEDFLSLPRLDSGTTTDLEQALELAPAELSTLVGSCNDDLKSAGMTVPETLIVRFAASLLSKRFLILTGLSGSGKTKLAHTFSAWLSDSPQQYQIVAVGADWTTNENLLGYQDALRPEQYRKPNNGALDLMLRATADTARPYFLVLDEMNLSHVERYFADMLSAIESGEPIALHSANGPLTSGNDDGWPVPQQLCLPKNLFVIGTVNVDETTHMFSPKVLDRANVIEFRANLENIDSFLTDPKPVNMGQLAAQGARFGAAFVATASANAPDLAKLGLALQTDDESTGLVLKQRLLEAFTILEPIGAEFGFRTALEISRFVTLHGMLSGHNWQLEQAIDAQIYQKLMPKLHGSERRLGPILKALAGFCEKHQYTMSLAKIVRMQSRLRDGFASFSEA